MKGAAALTSANAHTGNHLVGAARQLAKHSTSIGFINRFESASYLGFLKNTHLRRGAIATAIMAVSMFISFAGLTNIVKYGYGYCGYWAIVFVIVPLLTVGVCKNRRFLKGLPDDGSSFEPLSGTETAM